MINAIASPIAVLGQAAYNGLERLRSGTARFASSIGWSIYLNRTRIDYAREVGDPTKNSMVVAIVGWIARNFAEAPVRVTIRATSGMREAIRPSATGAGRMLQLLERPNRYFSGALMWMAVMTDRYTTGNAYIYKRRSPTGTEPRRVEELWWLPKRFVRPNWPEDGSKFIGWYEYSVDGHIYAIPENDIIHLRDGIDPENPRLGLSKLASLFREIYTDDEASNFTASLLTNLGVPGVVIAPANTTGGVKADGPAIKKAFMESFGADKRGEPLILTSPTDIKVLSWSPEQMNLRELRRIPEERASAVLGIPAAVVGLGSGLDTQAFTSYRDARIAAYEESVIPDQRLIASELEVQLLPEFVGEAEIERFEYDVDFDTSNVRALQESINEIWKRNESAATKGLVTRATFKRATGQPVAEGDDIYILPNNYVTVGVGGQNSPGARAFLTAEAEPIVTTPERLLLGVGGGPVRCSKADCNRLLAEHATPPYRFTCSRCKAVTEAAEGQSRKTSEYEYDAEGRVLRVLESVG